MTSLYVSEDANVTSHSRHRNHRGDGLDEAIEMRMCMSDRSQRALSATTLIAEFSLCSCYGQASMLSLPGLIPYPMASFDSWLSPSRALSSSEVVADRARWLRSDMHILISIASSNPSPLWFRCRLWDVTLASSDTCKEIIVIRCLWMCLQLLRGGPCVMSHTGWGEVWSRSRLRRSLGVSTGCPLG